MNTVMDRDMYKFYLLWALTLYGTYFPDLSVPPFILHDLEISLPQRCTCSHGTGGERIKTSLEFSLPTWRWSDGLASIHIIVVLCTDVCTDT